MQTMIHDTTIVTADNVGAIHEDAAIVIASDRIHAIGPAAELMPQYPMAERVDGRGKAVMPGFANLHTHLGLTLARGIFEDYSQAHTPPFAVDPPRPPRPQLSDDEHRVMRQLGMLEAIRSGTTLVVEDDVGIQGYADALLESGLRVLMCERVWDRRNGSYGEPGPFEADPVLAAAGLDRIEQLHCGWHGQGNGRLQAGLAAWSPDMCSPELLRDLRALQERLEATATIHLNQLWSEVTAVQEQRGLPPTEYLAQCNFLSNRLIAAHCRCMTAAEEQLLAASGATVSFNSAMAARRGLSPRIAELEAGGCTIGIGTDNMAEDMVEAMRTGMFMERVRRGDGRYPTPDQALMWATRNGYRALGIEDAGWLSPGNKADFIMVDLRKAHLVPIIRIVSSWVHQGQGRDVEAVMVDGQWLMRNGAVLTMDEHAIVTEANRIGRAAWRRTLSDHPQPSPIPGLTLAGGDDL